MKSIHVPTAVILVLGLILVFEATTNNGLKLRGRGPSLSIRQDLGYLARLLSFRTRSRAQKNIRHNLSNLGKRSVDEFLSNGAVQQAELLRHRRLSASVPTASLAEMLRAHTSRFNTKRILQLAERQSTLPDEEINAEQADMTVPEKDAKHDKKHILSPEEETFLYESIKQFILQNLDDFLDFLSNSMERKDSTETSVSVDVKSSKVK